MNQREIKFRAIRTDSVERYGKPMFVEGYLVKTPITAEWNDNREGGHFFDSGGNGRYCIITDSGVAHEIDIKTLGQYTNLHDKNGKEIYEGDVVRLDSWGAPQQIKFIEGAFCLADRKVGEFTGDIHYIHHAGIPQAEVIGNIYENPELLT